MRPGPPGRWRAPSSSSTSSSSTMGSGGILRSGISGPGPSSDGWITKHRQLNPGVYEIGASPGDTFEDMCAPILEHEPRARDQILYGVGYEDFSGAGEPSNSCSDVNGNAGELRPYDFALTGVKTRANVEAHQPDLIADRLSSPNGASWD